MINIHLNSKKNLRFFVQKTETANSNILVNPSAVSLTCSPSNGAAITLSLNSNYAPAGLLAPSGSVSMTVAYTNASNR